jgi:hypothetical protein
MNEIFKTTVRSSVAPISESVWNRFGCDCKTFGAISRHQPATLSFDLFLLLGRVKLTRPVIM